MKLFFKSEFEGKKIMTFLLIAIILIFVLSAQEDKYKILQSRMQAYINEADGLSQGERFNRLGEAMVEFLKIKIIEMEDTNQWFNRYGIKENKLILWILFPEDMDKPQFDAKEYTIKKGMYSNLVRSLKFAIEMKELGDKVEIITLNIERQKELLQSLMGRIYNPQYIRQLGLFKPPNSYYEFEATELSEGIWGISGNVVSLQTGDQFAFTPLFEISVNELIKLLNEPFTVTTLYQAPVDDIVKIINDGHPVYSGGKIGFEIQFPELGGYLIVYLKDSQNKVYNLFPGTKEAIQNGNYLIPECIEDPYTEIQSKARFLSYNRIRIQAFKLDENLGIETFYFHYLTRRNKNLEDQLIKEALDVGTNLSRRKGVHQKIFFFSKDVPESYRKEIKLKHVK